MLFDLQYFTHLLQSFKTHNSIQQGRQIHLLFLKRGLLASSLSVANRLLQMYVKCGVMNDARKLFDEMPHRNSFSWNSMIEGYMKLGHCEKGLELFNLMWDKDDFSWNVVISGFAKMGDLSLARVLFDQMPRKNGIAWNSMIHGYARCGYPQEALRMFKGLSSDPVELQSMDTFVLTTIIGVCTDLMSLECGKQIHARIVIDGVQFDSVLVSSLVNFYGKCGELDYASHVLNSMKEPNEFSLSALISGYASNSRIDEARRIFDSIRSPCLVACNSMLSGYVLNNKEMEALVLFGTMVKNGVQVDSSTFSSILTACTSISDLERGKQLHAHTCKIGVLNDVIVACALIDMYSKCKKLNDACDLFTELEFHDTILLNSMINVYSNCGRIQDAQQMFRDMKHKTLISWNSMLTGLSQNGYPVLALNLFREMNELGLRTDKFSIASVLSACASVSSLELGEQAFARAVTIGLDSDPIVCTSLIDFYCKCGFVDLGRKLFDGMKKFDEVSWNSMLIGYATNGHGIEALSLFDDMRRSGVHAGDITFTAVLSACDHCGLVEEARKWFYLMQSDYKINPGYEHYSCMVDLYARSGYLEEALTLIKDMPFKADASLWSSVLRGCVAHANKALGKSIAELIMALDPENSGAYVQLSGVFASSGDWEGSARVRDMMKRKRIEKNPGHTWFET